MNTDIDSKEPIFILRGREELSLNTIFDNKTFAESIEALKTEANEFGSLETVIFIVENAGYSGGQIVMANSYSLETDSEFKMRQKRLSAAAGAARRAEVKNQKKRDEIAKSLIATKALSKDAQREVYEMLKNQLGE
jgi:hypothetical protein